jgi:RNA polymerase subunit RPABC4/transcription elongation factor Spt4
MFFFIGGIQPKTTRVEKLARSCPKCGNHSVYKKRIDHYVSLFFLPILPVKKGDEFTVCENCGSLNDGRDGSGSQPVVEQSNRCFHCGAILEQGFIFCPYCGGRRNDD